MSLAPFLPKIPGLTLLRFSMKENKVEFTAQSTCKTALCPICQQVSRKVHSKYIRKPRDLPMAGNELILYVEVRRFFCNNSSCPRKIFAERFGKVLPYYSRRTGRLTDQIEVLGFDLGGEPGSKVARKIGIEVSPDTILRILHDYPDSPFPSPRVLGVDDWAFQKGRSYGTILVDLETRRPIDLLPDRESETLVQWLEEHPGVEIISRDRAGAYAQGAKEGAPEAIQVADRWHLLQNLSQALERMLHGQASHLRTATIEVVKEIEVDTDTNEPPVESHNQGKDSVSVASTTRASEKKRQNFERVKQLQKQGKSIRTIAKEVGIHRSTVRKYIAMGELPPRAFSLSSMPKITPYQSLILSQWEQGTHKATEIHQQIKAEGFEGSYASVRRFIRKAIKAGTLHQKEQAVPPCPRSLSAKQASFILSKDPEKLTEKERLFLHKLRESSQLVDTGYSLAQEFSQMLRRRTAKKFDSWMDKAQNCEIAALKNFATKLKGDYAAVKAAMEYEWSNGQVEGQVNRLKMIKRQMYGRAGFDLLRKRVLYAPRSG